MAARAHIAKHRAEVLAQLEKQTIEISKATGLPFDTSGVSTRAATDLRQAQLLDAFGEFIDAYHSRLVASGVIKPPEPPPAPVEENPAPEAPAPIPERPQGPTINDRRGKLATMPQNELNRIIERSRDRVPAHEVDRAVADRDRAVDLIVTRDLDIDAGLDIPPIDTPEEDGQAPVEVNERRKILDQKSDEELRSLIVAGIDSGQVNKEKDDLDKLASNREDAIRFIMARGLDGLPALSQGAPEEPEDESDEDTEDEKGGGE